MRLLGLITRRQHHATKGSAPRRRTLAALCAFSLAFTTLAGSLFGVTPAATGAPAASEPDMNRTPVPDYNVNLSKYSLRMPTTAQLRALDSLKASIGDSELTARWDKKTGSVDTIFDFASAPSSLDPEAAARSFIQTNAGLFGITDMQTLRLKSNHEALGGNVIYFEQTHNGVPVAGRGVGVILDSERRVKMVSGPYEKNMQVSTAPSLAGAAAVTKALTDLSKYKVTWATGVADKLNPALDLLASQLGPMSTPAPHLSVFPTTAGPRLTWKFYVFSRNPFGFFKYHVDAASGEVLYREDTVRYQTQDVLPVTADIYPTFPCITPELKDQGIISNDPATGRPCGQLRVNLRKFDASNSATGTLGQLTGTHALINYALPLRAPFPQAALGTYHFSSDNPAGFEARTNEREHYGPGALFAEHQDAVSQFFYITSLVEYIDYLHRAGDSKHSQVGQGDFPDTYPNQSSPLIGNVHIPNVLAPPTNPQDPEFLPKLLGLDNAFSVSASSREVLGEDIAGQNVIVNPTSYGHGYLLNDLAIDFGVPYHEGMHSISSPIAGLENDPDGAPEGSALNEAQADLWAYTAAENPQLGHYVLNGFKYREAVRAAGNNPDQRQHIRHADSGLLYTQIGTYQGGYEEHRDGEIFAAAGWDLRELMIMYQTGGAFARPDIFSGEATRAISKGQENWERILLGTIYVLSAFNPDTMVRARDAMIIADQSLYSSDPSDPDAPGQHRALIEQVFAARELGVNAVAPDSQGRQTVSTKVSDFAASQAAPDAPVGVTVSPASSTSNRVEWRPARDAFAYEVLRRQVGKENRRQNDPVVGREYKDGDGATDGFMHIAYVSGDQTAYTDNGLYDGAFVPRGVKNPISYEYVVRSLGVNSNRQVGVSANSAASNAPTAVVDVSANVRTVNSNFAFSAGRAEFDQAIKNLGGAGADDGTLYTPIDFRIVSISDPSVTVANADNGGKGTAASPASFYYRDPVAAGTTSKTRRLAFNNPNNVLFTVTAVVTARVLVDPSQATRYEGEPDFSGNFTTTTFSETFTGIVPASDTGLQVAGGVTYVDVPFTSKDGATAVTGVLTSPTTGVDLDFELRDSTGRVIASSGTASAEERVTAAIQPKSNYTYRVVGWAGAAQDFQIVSTQTLRVPAAGQTGGSSSTGSGLLRGLLRFTVNPLTRTVSLLK